MKETMWIGDQPEDPEVVKLRDLEESYTYCRVTLGASASDLLELAAEIDEQRAIVQDRTVAAHPGKLALLSASTGNEVFASDCQ